MASQRRVTVTGPAAPGPSGILIAPLSGLECVWYRVAAQSWQVHGDDHHWRQVVGHQRGSPLTVGDVLLDAQLASQWHELVVLEELQVRQPPTPAQAPMLHKLAGIGLVPPDELARKANAFDSLAWKVTEHAIRPGQPVEATGKIVTRRGQRILRRPWFSFA